MATWRHQQYGSATDAVRQSDLGDIASAYGCAKRFAFRKREEAASMGAPRKRERLSAKMALGTAVHETIRRALEHPDYSAGILDSRGERLPTEARVLETVEAELRAESEREGAPIDWYGDDSAVEKQNAVMMVRGALREVGRRAKKVIACEAPFVAELGGFFLGGTIDIVFEALDGALVLADWKTGAQRMHPIVLAHGYQIAMYSHAVGAGTFYPGEAREMRIGRHPDRAFIVHLRDHIPYAKKTTKAAERAEEAAFFKVAQGEKVTCVAGDERGPGWYAANRRPEDVARFGESLRNIVNTVRLGRFIETIDEHCVRCPYKGPCLTDGHAVSGDEAKQLEAALRGVDLGDASDLAA